MDVAFLEGLGLTVAEAGGSVQAQLQLRGDLAINPLTRQTIEAVTFTVIGDRLLYVGPAEFVGAQPINLAFITPATRLEELVAQTLNDHLYQLERRSNELTAMGVMPHVEPETLQLTAELKAEPFHFVIGANRAGHFKVQKVSLDGAELSQGGPTLFELSEFRDRAALESFLLAMFADLAKPDVSAPPRVTSNDITFTELAAAFSGGLVPSRSPLEVLAELRVDGQSMRFAAARLQGRTFRGLLAGPQGKLWADRFELGEFPGVRELVAKVLKVPVEKIELVQAGP